MSDTSKTDCMHPAGTFPPVIDPLRCEGKDKCANVCPSSVFEICKLTGPDCSALLFLTRLKVSTYGGKQSFATLASECRACSNYVTSCPEGTIYFGEDDLIHTVDDDHVSIARVLA
jgi:NAD-dependent dihydropyrimidine dehydrogenase PreA subunit